MPRHKDPIECPKCGKLLAWEPRDPGDPPTWESPMGGAPPFPAGWYCDDCDEFVEDDDAPLESSK